MPSTMAVLPTPASPIRQGLFLERRRMICGQSVAADQHRDHVALVRSVTAQSAHAPSDSMERVPASAFWSWHSPS